MPRGSGRDAKRAAAQKVLKGGADSDGPLPGRGEQAVDGFAVRPTSGEAGKVYRCPGCDHELVAPTPHLVAWPEGSPDERRHWHRACWQARERRGVKVHRAKNAPRYG